MRHNVAFSNQSTSSPHTVSHTDSNSHSHTQPSTPSTNNPLARPTRQSKSSTPRARHLNHHHRHNRNQQQSQQIRNQRELQEGQVKVQQEEERKADNTYNPPNRAFRTRLSRAPPTTCAPPKRRLSAFSTSSTGTAPRLSLLRRGTSALKRAVTSAAAPLTRKSSSYTDGLSDYRAPPMSDASSSTRQHHHMLPPASDEPRQPQRHRRFASDLVASHRRLSSHAAPPVSKSQTLAHPVATADPDASADTTSDVSGSTKSTAHRRQTSVPQLPDSDPLTASARDSQHIPAPMSSRPRLHTYHSSAANHRPPSTTSSKNPSLSVHPFDSSSSVITPPLNDRSSEDCDTKPLLSSDPFSDNTPVDVNSDLPPNPVSTGSYPVEMSYFNDRSTDSKFANNIVDSSPRPSRTATAPLISSNHNGTAGQAHQSTSSPSSPVKEDEPQRPSVSLSSERSEALNPKGPSILPTVKNPVLKSGSSNYSRRFSSAEPRRSIFTSRPPTLNNEKRDGDSRASNDRCNDDEEVEDNTNVELQSSLLLNRRHTSILQGSAQRVAKPPSMQPFLSARRTSAPLKPVSQSLPSTQQPRARPSDASAARPPLADSGNASRVNRTGFMERSVAAAVISAARHRNQGKKNRSTLPSKPAHHRRHGGFENPWPSAFKDVGLRSRGGSGSRTFFLKAAKDRRPPEEQLASMILLAAAADFIASADAIRRDKYALASTWIGHSTFFLQAHGITVLTDPVWSPRLGPLGPKRLIPPPCEIEDLPESIDVVILSSASYDHYDKNTIIAIASRVGTWLVPLGLKSLLAALGIQEKDIVELDWWGQHEVKGTQFICTPAQHQSLRDGTLWCSWAVLAKHHSFFYCGATGYRSVDRDGDDGETYESRVRYGGPTCPAFAEIGKRYRHFDTAFLPIGGYKPRALMSGVQGDAVDMLFIHQDVKSKRSIAHRWGTYACNDEGLLDPIRTLEYALQTGPVGEQEFCYLKHGRLHVT